MSVTGKSQVVSKFWDNLTTVTKTLLVSEPFSSFVCVFQNSFTQLGVPTSHVPTAEQIGLSLSMAGLTLAIYYISTGEKNSRKRKDLENKLTQGNETIITAL